MNRKFIIFFIALFFIFRSAIAQDEKPEEIKIGNLSDTKLKRYKFSQATDSARLWKINGNVNIGFSQVEMVNWASGGNDVVGLNAIVFLKAEYKKNRLNWINTADLGYGTQKVGNDGFRKNDDRLEINSQLNYQAGKHWFYSVMMNFRTQMGKGFDFPDDTTKVLVSKILNPGFLTIGIGMDYKPVEWFNLFLSPITSKTVFVLNNTKFDPTRYGIDSGDHVFQNAGAFISARVVKEVFKNVTVNTQLNLFSNYLEKPENVDVNWLTSINLKVNKFLSVAILTELIYDDDTFVPKKIVEGEVVKGKGVQFREVLTIGIGYQFNSKEKKKVDGN